MNIYDIWIADRKNYTLIANMETAHINNCVNQIYKAAGNWRCTTFEMLTKEDMQSVSETLNKAWFVIHARAYLYSFRKELIKRGESIETVDAVIVFVH